MNPAGADYFAIPSGSRLDHRAERLETLRRHQILGTYKLTMFLQDLFTDQKERVVTADNLALHLQCVRISESTGLREPLSEARILEMVLEAVLDTRPSADDLASVDDSILEALGLRTAMAH